MRRREFLCAPVAARLALAQAGSLEKRVAAALRKHLDMLLGADGTVVPLKGKDGAAVTALSFEVMHGVTGEAKYRRAAVSLADEVLQQMKAAKFGVLAIKEKQKGEETIVGGGPPPLGWYALCLGYVYRRAGGRNADLKYVAGLLDRFPWNPDGWWSADIDVMTGISKVPMDHPSPVNKNCAMAMATAALSEYVQPLDAALANSLRAKTLKCIQKQIIPAQQKDGYWHYGLTERDPNNKDVLGYFMLATGLLIRLRLFAPSYRDAALAKTISKAEEFAAKNIAPVTYPFHGQPSSPWTTPSTPKNYDLDSDLKRSYQLGVLLYDGKYREQTQKIMGAALDHFLFGDTGQQGAICARESACILMLASVG